MRSTAVVSQMLVRLSGAIEIVLGILFWTGRARSWIPIHMLVGLILVLALWVLAVVALRAHVGRGAGIFAIVWGLIVLALGVTQMQLLPGGLHWVVQVVHLFVGLAAIGIGESLAARIRVALAPPVG